MKKTVSNLHEVSIFSLIVEDVEPGVLVERGVVVSCFQYRSHVEAVSQGLQGYVPRE